MESKLSVGDKFTVVGLVAEFEKNTPNSYFIEVPELDEINDGSGTSGFDLGFPKGSKMSLDIEDEIELTAVIKEVKEGKKSMLYKLEIFVDPDGPSQKEIGWFKEDDILEYFDQIGEASSEKGTTSDQVPYLQNGTGPGKAKTDGDDEEEYDEDEDYDEDETEI